MKIYKVGGAVRDSLCGVESVDNDWVVIGSSGFSDLIEQH